MKVKRPLHGPSVREKVRAFSGARLDAAGFLDPFADAFGSRPLFYFDNELTLPTSRPGALSYEELRSHAARLASAYAALGLRPGDTIAFITLNRLELAIAALAALRAGLVAVPLNFMLTEHEIASAVERSGARVLVADSVCVEHNLKGAPERSGAERVVLLDGTGPGSLADLAGADEAPPAVVRPEDPALIFFTSGTTGEPKGATISHGALASVIRRNARAGMLLPTPRSQLSLLVMPLAHNGGFMAVIIQLCLAIPTLVLSRFSSEHVLRTIEEHRPTMFTGTPAMYRMLIEAGAEGYDLSSIRVWGGGADLFPRELLDRIRALGGWKRFGIRFKPFTMIGYGSAETAGQVTISPPMPVGDRCIGWVLPGFRYRIMDEEGHPSRTGELQLRGGSVMSGYWEDTGATSESLEQGWFHTGDIVRRGRLGLLYYEARRKDVIKSGGYSIAAREIESVLEQHPAVRQAAAVGVPDNLRGELPVAAVVLRDDVVSEGELEAWVSERLAGYKRPRHVHIVDEIPLTPTLKPKKSEVRDMLMRLRDI